MGSSVHRLGLGLDQALSRRNHGSSPKPWRQEHQRPGSFVDMENISFPGYLLYLLILGETGGWWNPRGTLFGTFASIKVRQSIVLSFLGGGVGQAYVCWEQVPLARPLLWQFKWRPSGHMTLVGWLLSGADSLPPFSPSHFLISLSCKTPNPNRAAKCGKAIVYLCQLSSLSWLALQPIEQSQTNISFEC